MRRAALVLLIVAILGTTGVATGGALPATPGPGSNSAESSDSLTAVSDQKPNIVVIMVDDMRYDDLAFMPNVQELLVKKGTSFDNFYSPFPLCCPARASFLTGLYAHNHGVLSNKPPYGGFSAFADDNTLPVWLDGDYRTGLVGKYLNKYGEPGSGSAQYVPPGWDSWNATLGMSTYDYMGIRMNSQGTIRNYQGRYSTHVIGSKANQFIKRSSTARPFFLFASFVGPHYGRPHEGDDPDTYKTPYAEPKYQNTYVGPPLPADLSFNETDVSDKRPSVRDNPPLTERQIANIVESYGQRRETLLSVDDRIRGLVAELVSARELRNTYIIFLSDNGYMQGEHRVYEGKGLPYTAASRVPLVIRGPGVPQAATVDGMAGTHDLAPTVLHMTETWGKQGPWEFDGRSLVPMLTREEVGDKRTLVLEAGDNAGGYDFHGIVRGNGWKFVEFTTAGVNEVEMYDLRADPFEEHNLSDDPAYDAKQAQLHALLEQYKY